MGFWALHLASLIRALLFNSKPDRSNVIFLSILFVLILVLSYYDSFRSVSLVQEFKIQEARLGAETLRHLGITGMSILFALALAVPIGVAAVRSRFGEIFIKAASLVQTIPSLALFGLLMVPLGALSTIFPVLRTWGISGIGTAPALVALTLYALLPLAVGVQEGLQSLPVGAVQAARGLGFSRWQILLKVEIPLALPLILAGLRVGVVQTLGNASLVPLIGAGGLGFFIFQGIGQTSTDMVLLGVLTLVLLTLISDRVLSSLTTLVKKEMPLVAP